MARYENELRSALTDPGSFRGSPGYKFALDTGMDAVSRKMAAGGMRGSGNALAAAMKFGQGVASQDYGAHVDRLLRASGQADQYDLGEKGVALGRDRLALDDRLGTDRLALDSRMGEGKLALDGLNSERDFGLSMYKAENDLALGTRSADTADQRAAWDYDLGREGNANIAARNANDYSLGAGRQDVDWYNARTNRSKSRADTYHRGREYDLEWMKQNPKGYY